MARLAAAGEPFDPCLANFLDDFQAAPSASALSEMPVLLAPALGHRGSVQDAYLAATAAHLAGLHGLPAPAWTLADERKLARPFFASPLAALRAVLILESPAAFRSRNIFVSENALTRV